MIRPGPLALVAALCAGCGGGAPAGPGAPDAAEAPCDGTPARPARQLAFATGGRWLAAAWSDGRVIVYELGGTTVRQLQVAHALPRIALTEDGSQLVAAAAGAVDLWSVADGTVVRKLATGTGTPVTVKLSDSPTPDLLVGFDPSDAPRDNLQGNLRVWRVADGILVGLATGSPLCTFTHADAALLTVNQQQGSFEVVSPGDRPIRRALFPQRLSAIAFAADGAYMGGVTGGGSDDEHVAIMSVSDEGFTWRSAVGTRRTRQLVFLENPSRVVQLAERVLVYDHNDGQVTTTLPGLDDARLLAGAPDGASLAAVTPDNHLRLVSSSDGSLRATWPALSPACR